MIYIASPYTHADPTVRHQRFEGVCRYVAERMLQGAVVYSPIAHSHPITERFNLPVTWDFWQHFDRAMIQRADALEVLMLDGWHRSVGVTAEINFARGLELPIVEFVRRLRRDTTKPAGAGWQVGEEPNESSHPDRRCAIWARRSQACSGGV